MLPCVTARALALSLLAAALPVTAVAQPQVPSPPGPTSRVLWEHDGTGVTFFEIRVDGVAAARIETVEPASAGNFEAPLPLMTPGPRTLVVAACNENGCTASDPLEVLVVSAPIHWWLPWNKK
jgi:hypothetical protein